MYYTCSAAFSYSLMIIFSTVVQLLFPTIFNNTLFSCVCVLTSQDQAFGELEKNSDKILQGTSSSDSSQPAHLHELLCSLQKQLLAYCHINCVTEVLAQLNTYHEQTKIRGREIRISKRPCIFFGQRSMISFRM